MGTVHDDDFSALDDKPVLVSLGSEDPLAREGLIPKKFSQPWTVLHQIREELPNCAELKFLMHVHARHEPHNDFGKQSVFWSYRDWILSNGTAWKRRKKEGPPHYPQGQAKL